MATPELDLPHDIEAERAVLAAAMLDSSALVESLTVLEPNFFYVEPHKLIFQAMLAMYSEGIPVDEVTLPSRLRDMGLLEKIGGYSYLSELFDTLPDISNVEHYAAIVDESRRLRSLKMMAQRISLYRGPFDDLLESVMTELYRISERGEREELRPIYHAVEAAVLDSEMISTGHQADVGMPTHFPRLDELLTVQGGKIVVLAGTTGSGKTSFALQVLDSIAQSGKKVAFFSLEMTEREIAERLLARRSLIALDALTRGRLDNLDRQRLERESRVFGQTEFYVCDDADVTVMDIRTRARKLQLQHGLDAVVVDYIQLVTPPKQLARRSREQEISFISRELKKMAKALNVAVFPLSQLNDNPEQQKRPPELRDLRESRAIGHDADAVLMLYRPEMTCPATELYVRKNRNGPLGKIEYAFSGSWVKFKELPKNGRPMGD